MTETDPGMVARVAALESALARLEALLGGSTSIIEGLNFPEGLRIPAGQGVTLAPGSAPDVAEGILYYDAADDSLKLRASSAWETVLSTYDVQMRSAAVSNLVDTTTETTIKSMSISMARAGNLLIWFHCNPNTATGKYTRFRLKLGTSTKRSNTYTQNPTGGRGQVGFCWLNALNSAGDRTIYVTAQNSDATYTTMFNDCTLVALALPF